MKKSIVFLLSVLGTLSVAAQFTGQPANYTANSADGGVSDALYNYAMGAISDKNAKASLIDDSIEGSPYMSNTFSSGKLYYGDELVGDIYYRYNAYNEEMEVKQSNLENERIRGLSKDKKIKLVALGKPMSFKTFVDKAGNTKNGYMTLLADGDYKLYRHLKVTFKEAKKAENTFVKSTPAKFSQFTEYYLEHPDGKRIDQIEMNSKKLMQLVEANKSDDLKAFLKESKIKVKNENDLYQIVNFLNNASGS